MTIAFTAGDGIALAALVFVAAGSIVSWVRGVLASRRAAVKAGEQRAATDATDLAAIKALAVSQERIAKALENLADLYRTHEVECAQFRGKIEESHTTLTKTQADIGRNLENLQRQVTNVALRLAPSDAQKLAANT